ncbi:hypothetical protein PC123_g24971 [Phytophthora cactorum]|nr:hypothetical protein PC123_g24971 [Phytophthora cactorum]
MERPQKLENPHCWCQQKSQRLTKAGTPTATTQYVLEHTSRLLRIRPSPSLPTVLYDATYETDELGVTTVTTFDGSHSDRVSCGVVISRRRWRPSASKDKTTFKLLKLQTLGHVTESDFEVRETRLGHYRRLVGAP